MMTEAVARRDVLGAEKAAAFRSLALSVRNGQPIFLDRCSTVYSTSKSKEVDRPDRRECWRSTLRESAVFDAIEQTLLPALLPGRATAVCRSHYDIIHYGEGNFFGPHRDFVRVRTSDSVVVQYFGVYSLAESPCEGGATGVEGVWYDAPTFPDGGLVSPAEFLHESAAVISGSKLIIKFDFLLMKTTATAAPAAASSSLNSNNNSSSSSSSAVAASEAERVNIVLARGRHRKINKDLLEAVPFFQAALRFPRSEGTPISLSGLDAADFDALLDYLRGGGRSPEQPHALLETMNMLCMHEVAAAPSWARFLAGAPIFVPEEAIVPLWENFNDHQRLRIVPFVVVTSQIAGSTRVTSAFALLPSGDHNRVVVIQSENPTPLGVSLFGHPSSTPREAADCAMKAFARGVASATSSDDEEEKSIYEWIKESTDNYYYYYTALRLRAPLILEMLQREASENSSGGTLKVDKLVEETEYCNDGNCETFWNYETVVIGCRFGLFRLQ